MVIDGAFEGAVGFAFKAGTGPFDEVCKQGVVGDVGDAEAGFYGCKLG